MNVHNVQIILHLCTDFSKADICSFLEGEIVGNILLYVFVDK